MELPESIDHWGDGGYTPSEVVGSVRSGCVVYIEDEFGPLVVTRYFVEYRAPDPTDRYEVARSKRQVADSYLQARYNGEICGCRAISDK